MAGVNPYGLEHPQALDIPGLALHSHRIFYTSGADHDINPQHSLGYHGRPDPVRDLAKKTLDREAAPFRRGRLFNLVLG